VRCRASVFRGVKEAATTYQRKLWRRQSPRSTLPNHSPAPPRCHVGEVLCHRFLRGEEPGRGNTRAGREFRRAPGRLCREGPQCPALPAQQLSTTGREQGRCRMKRRIQGLGDTATRHAHAVPDGVFLVRVDRAEYRWHPAKPFYILRLSVLEPSELAGRMIAGRVYCTAKALWKLGWFLRDFLYDPELLGREEVDEKALSGLRGVVKI